MPIVNPEPNEPISARSLSDFDFNSPVIEFKNNNVYLLTAPRNNLPFSNQTDAYRLRLRLMKSRALNLNMLMIILVCFVCANFFFYAQLVIQKFNLFPSLNSTYGFKLFVLVSVWLNFLSSPLICLVYLRFHRHLNAAIRETFKVKSYLFGFTQINRNLLWVGCHELCHGMNVISVYDCISIRPCLSNHAIKQSKQSIIPVDLVRFIEQPFHRRNLYMTQLIESRIS